MKNSRTAFTLIELLVVIAIIGVLASISIPVINAARQTGYMTRAMSNARGIGLGLTMYANDHDGVFPAITNSLGQPIQTSNDAFRSLVPAYVDIEEVFAVGQSKVGPKADNKIETTEEILEPGENHWAYVAGLASTSNPRWPLVADSTDGNGTYTTIQSEPGGTWGGKKAVIVRVDNSAEVVLLNGTGDLRFVPRFDDPASNALALDYMKGAGVLLEPAKP